ncbi:hypothetical protein RF11_07473 [Thelohanellus kitauei]|uniref:Uncharacterized protein n=1 Tax=Thelohanellus kitauei TaxID=669202 RepID=A0A0C2J7R1_THEKT|nr:hypothetical protein RF11_07473 [Thelohanellus kitauei]
MIEIKKFLHDVISTLIDADYVIQIQKEQNLFLYEDLKNSQLSIMDRDFIEEVFLKCISYITKTRKYWIPEDSGNAEYKIFQQVMTWLVISFNQSKHLCIGAAKYYLRLCNLKYDNSSTVLKNIDNSCGVYDSTSISKKTANKTEHYRPSFPALFRCFMYIYELKFIFGDIDSKFSLNFLYSHRL